MPTGSNGNTIVGALRELYADQIDLSMDTGASSNIIRAQSNDGSEFRMSYGFSMWSGTIILDEPKRKWKKFHK